MVKNFWKIWHKLYLIYIKAYKIWSIEKFSEVFYTSWVWSRGKLLIMIVKVDKNVYLYRISTMLWWNINFEKDYRSFHGCHFSRELPIKINAYDVFDQYIYHHTFRYIPMKNRLSWVLKYNRVSFKILNVIHILWRFV